MTELESLNLAGTKVDDLSAIRGLNQLVVLYLSNAPITDAGLAPVAGFTGLDFLALDGTKITDAGLAHLAEMKNSKASISSKLPLPTPGLRSCKCRAPRSRSIASSILARSPGFRRVLPKRSKAHHRIDAHELAGLASRRHHPTGYDRPRTARPSLAK